MVCEQLSMRTHLYSGDASSPLRRVWLRSDVMAASLAIHVLGLALPIAILQMYDRVIRYHSVSTAYVLVLGVVVAFCLEFFLRTLRARIMSTEGARYDHREKCRTLERLLATDIETFKTDTPGTHAERFHAIQTVRTFYCQAGTFLADVPFMIVFVAMIAVIAGWMAIVPLILLAGFVCLGLLVARHLTVETGRRELNDVKRHNFLVECIRGIMTIKSLGLEPTMQRRFERLQEEAADNFGSTARIAAQTQSIAGELAQAASVLTVAIGAVAVVNGDLTIGGLAATTILTGRLLQPVLKGLDLWSRYPFIRLAEDKVRKIQSLNPRLEGRLPFPRHSDGALTLQNLSFRYANANRDAVDGVTINIPRHSYIAITGPTSSGRTTLLKLLNGSLTPTSGSIRFDDIPLAFHAPQELRRQIALMPASPTLYPGSLLENLTLFEDGPVKRRALALCRVLGLEDYLAGLTRGLETQLSGAGDTPMGVAQRISIIRSLAQDPQIVLFDTANNALDHDADRMLLSYFERQRGKRTAVFVTDRPSYLRMCDTVYEMAGGRLRLRPEAASPTRQAGGAAL